MNRGSLQFQWLWQLVGLTLVVLVFWGCLKPPSDDIGFSLNDKLVHFMAYFVLALWYGGIVQKRFHAVIAVLLIGMGVLIEWLQIQTGYRHAEWADVLANLVGIIMGLLLAGLLSISVAAWLESHMTGLADKPRAES
tara:strand:+ start:83 stop:493 length:411 start_codon:yes stop_codon:yes gene_type:complete